MTDITASPPNPSPTSLVPKTPSESIQALGSEGVDQAQPKGDAGAPAYELESYDEESLRKKYGAEEVVSPAPSKKSKAPRTLVDPKTLRRGQRSQARLHELKRKQDDLLKPEGRTELVATRLEPAVKARFDAEAAKSGVSPSALLHLAVHEYLHGAEQRSMLERMERVGAVVAETGAAFAGANEEVRTRMSRLEDLVERLTETVANQEAKFITVEDLERTLGADGDESDSESNDDSGAEGG